jgi:uncharacterized protein YndB with AHSA1/START domain
MLKAAIGTGGEKVLMAASGGHSLPGQPKVPPLAHKFRHRDMELIGKHPCPTPFDCTGSWQRSPKKVYRAFVEADAMAKWLPPNGFACTVHHLDAKIGGSFRMTFRNFTTGKSHSFGGQYLELVPGERVRYTDKFEDPNLPGEIQVTVALKPVSCGTSETCVLE